MALPDPPPPMYPIRAAKRVNRAMFFLGAALFVAGFRFFLLPDELARTSVGRTLPGIADDAWSMAYLVGGLLIMAGVGARRPRLELPGITLAGTAIIVNALAIFTVSSTAWSQVPLYALALWVLDGRARDLLELPHERRRGRFCSSPDPRPHKDRTERRLNVVAFPIVAAAAIIGATSPSSSPVVTLAIVLLGGGIFTAFVQVLLYRPQRRSLEAMLSKTAVETATAALAAANERVDELEETLDKANDRIAALERERDELKRREGELEKRVDELEHLVESAE